MKLVNKSEQFVLKFNGEEYTVPAGEFEVTNEDLAQHIIFKSYKWQKDVTEVPNYKTNTIKSIGPTPIEPVPMEKKADEPVFGGASTETLPKKQGRPRKVNVQ